MTNVARRAVAACLMCIPMAVLSAVTLRHDLFAKVVVSANTLPAKVEDWTGEAVPLTQAELSMLDSPASSQRSYKDLAGDQVQILVLQVNDTQNAHDPKLCMQGSGFSVASDNVTHWPDDKKGPQISKALFKKEDAQEVTMYYWLQTPSGNIADLSAGFKWEGIKRALVGSAIRGISVRVIALPNLNTGQPTDPTMAVRLWKTISTEVHFDQLVKELE